MKRVLFKRIFRLFKELLQCTKAIKMSLAYQCTLLSMFYRTLHLFPTWVYIRAWLEIIVKKPSPWKEEYLDFGAF